MLQAIAAGSSASARTDTTPSGNAGASVYASDWRDAVTIPIAQLPPTAPPKPANDTDLTARAKTDALLSADVYKDVPAPPAGFHVASNAELKELGLTPQMLERPGLSSFRARVYVSGSAEAPHYTVAFRGSQTGEDWKNNFAQGAGLDAPSYDKALQIGRQLARDSADITVTGHSLGGGLASATAIASGREADTFNAAGLSDRTIGQARAIAQAAGRGSAAVQAYHVPGEALTLVQEGGDRVAGTILGGIFGGPVGGALGGAKADAPSAYGTHHTLPDVRPAGKGLLDSLNPVDRHKIDWVLAGAAALR